MSARVQRWATAPVRVWLRWVAFMSAREDAASLAVARIVSGSTICVHLATMGLTGVATQAWVDVKYGGARTSFIDVWLSYFGGATPNNVNALITVGCIAAALMTLGIATRISIVFTWLCFHTLTDTNYLAGGSSDDLLLNGLFVLIWSGSGNALSVDQWLKRRRDPNASCEAPAWPRYVLIFQIITVYWTTGMQKVSNGWWPPPMGTLDSIWFILQDPSWTRWVIDGKSLAPFFRLTQLATLTTWLFENSGLLLLLAYWYRYTRERPGRVRAFFNAPLGRFRGRLGPFVDRIDFRLLYLCVGFSMHFGIWVLMEVGPFFNSALVCYACCITPAEWRAVLAKLRIVPASPVPAAAS